MSVFVDNKLIITPFLDGAVAGTSTKLGDKLDLQSLCEYLAEQGAQTLVDQLYANSFFLRLADTKVVDFSSILDYNFPIVKMGDVDVYVDTTAELSTAGVDAVESSPILALKLREYGNNPAYFKEWISIAAFTHANQVDSNVCGSVSSLTNNTFSDAEEAIFAIAKGEPIYYFTYDSTPSIVPVGVSNTIPRSQGMGWDVAWYSRKIYTNIKTPYVSRWNNPTQTHNFFCVPSGIKLVTAKIFPFTGKAVGPWTPITVAVAQRDATIKNCTANCGAFVLSDGNAGVGAVVTYGLALDPAKVKRVTV